MDIWIFEDDYIFQNKLVSMLNTYKDALEDTSVFGTIHVIEHKHMELLDTLELKPKSTHLFIIDVDLKKSYNGFDLAKRIREYDYDSEIVFITSHIELMNNAFLLNLKALNYIYKLDPILEERVKTVLAVIQKNKIKKQAMLHVNKQESKRLLLTSRDVSKKIIIDEIIAIETDTLRRKTIVKTLDEVIETKKSLKELLEELPGNFIKSHRSIILNLDYIKEISIRDGYYQAIMTSGERYDISRNYVKTLSQSFNKVFSR